MSRVANHAGERGVGFSALGLVTTRDFRRGLDHLKHLRDFDEISIGEHASNAISLDYFWNEGLTPSTPQIVVFERVTHLSVQDSLSAAFAGSQIRRLGRATGLAALTQWAASDRPMPPSSADLDPPIVNIQQEDKSG